MPTGYTSDLYDLKDVSRNDFILTCARAFGATIHQRDDNIKDRPKHRVPNYTYIDESYNRAIRDLDAATKWTPDEADREARKSYEKAMDSWERSVAKSAARRAKYESMLRQIRRWEPPTEEHEGLKTFMIEQLEESIRFDCHGYTEPSEMTGKEYKEQTLAAARRDIKYYEERRIEERDRANGANKWIDDLYESLGL